MPFPPCFLTREIFAPIEAGGWRGCVVDLAEVAFRVRGILFEGGGGDDEAVVERRGGLRVLVMEKPTSQRAVLVGSLARSIDGGAAASSQRGYYY